MTLSFPPAEHLDVSLADDVLTVTFREGLAAFIEKRDPKFTGR